MRSVLLARVAEIRQSLRECLVAVDENDLQRCRRALEMLVVSLADLEQVAWRIGYPKGKARKVTPELIRQVKEWKGSKAEIARRLGISRKTVYSILKGA
jgi:hypothetical protein